MFWLVDKRGFSGAIQQVGRQPGGPGQSLLDPFVGLVEDRMTRPGPSTLRRHGRSTPVRRVKRVLGVQRSSNISVRSIRLFTRA